MTTVAQEIVELGVRYDRAVRLRDAIRNACGEWSRRAWADEMGGPRLWYGNVHPRAGRPALTRQPHPCDGPGRLGSSGDSPPSTRVSASQRIVVTSRMPCGHLPTWMAFSWPTRCITSRVRRHSSTRANVGWSPRRFLIVEYDTDESSRWVPHPVSLKSWFAVHRRRLFVDGDVAVAAIGLSACFALCRPGMSAPA